MTSDPPRALMKAISRSRSGTFAAIVQIRRPAPLNDCKVQEFSYSEAPMSRRGNSPESPLAPKAAKARSPINHQWMAGLGELLKGARVGRFTIEQLAERSGVSAGRISQMERGLGNPSFATLSKVAAALEIPIGTFFAGPPGES